MTRANLKQQAMVWKLLQPAPLLDLQVVTHLVKLMHHTGCSDVVDFVHSNCCHMHDCVIEALMKAGLSCMAWQFTARLGCDAPHTAVVALHDQQIHLLPPQSSKRK